MNNKKIKSFTKEAAIAIENYLWPGNVRELENIIKRAVIMTDDVQISLEDLDLGDNSETMMPLNLKKDFRHY